MRFREFKTEAKSVPKPKKSSSEVRYNSEVGMLAAFCGADISNFDPKNPANSIPAESLRDPDQTYKDIVKHLAPNYDAKIFSQYFSLGQRYKDMVFEQLSVLNEPAPVAYDWSAGSNINPLGPADVEFFDHPTMNGVSIKTESGITLANLSPSLIGLNSEENVLEHPDVFARYAEFEWLAMKYWAIQQTLKIARETPEQAFAPIKPKYQIIYHPGQIPAAPSKQKQAKKQPAPQALEPTPGISNSNSTLAVSKEPMGSEPAAPIKPVRPISEQADQGYFEFFFKGKTKNFTEAEIYDLAEKNEAWQRVFGDYVQTHWEQDGQLRELGDNLFSSISEIFVDKIRTALQTKEKLHRVIAMGKLGYFYATPKELYFVPGIDQIDNIVVKDVVYGAPDGTSQKFIAKIGVEGGTDEAQVLVYVRYANGMFETNPTVRIQDLKNPGALTWTKLA